MKKIIMFLFLFLTFGCSNNMFNTPTKKVEMFLSKYQSLDDSVLRQLDEVADDNLTLTEDQKEKYIKIMKRHYESLKYDIDDEKIDGDTATVTVTIEVMDYSKILEDANQYLEEHKEEFLNENEEYDETTFNDYRLSKLEKAEDTIKYTIDLTLTNIEGVWVIDDLTKDNQDKIQGIYKY